jgi:hypothetical protein
MIKTRISIYLEPEICAAFERKAAAAGVAKSALAEAAIAAWVSPDQDRLAEAAVLRRLDTLQRLGERLDRNLEIAIEMQALYLRYWLTATPPLAEAAKTAAHAKGKERYEGFIEALGRRLAQDRRLSRDLSFDRRAPEPVASEEA